MRACNGAQRANGKARDSNRHSALLCAVRIGQRCTMPSVHWSSAIPPPPLSAHYCRHLYAEKVVQRCRSRCGRRRNKHPATERFRPVTGYRTDSPAARGGLLHGRGVVLRALPWPSRTPDGADRPGRPQREVNRASATTQADACSSLYIPQAVGIRHNSERDSPVDGKGPRRAAHSVL